MPKMPKSAGRYNTPVNHLLALRNLKLAKEKKQSKSRGTQTNAAASAQVVVHISINANGSKQVPAIAKTVSNQKRKAGKAKRVKAIARKKKSQAWIEIKPQLDDEAFKKRYETIKGIYDAIPQPIILPYWNILGEYNTKSGTHNCKLAEKLIGDLNRKIINSTQCKAIAEMHTLRSNSSNAAVQYIFVRIAKSLIEETKEAESIAFIAQLSSTRPRDKFLDWLKGCKSPIQLKAYATLFQHSGQRSCQAMNDAMSSF